MLTVHGRKLTLLLEIREHPFPDTRTDTSTSAHMCTHVLVTLRAHSSYRSGHFSDIQRNYFMDSLTRNSESVSKKR